MKKLSTVVVLILFCAILWARGAGETSASEASAPVKNTEVTISVPTGAPVVSVAEMVEKGLPRVDGYDVNWDIVTSADLMGARVISGQADFAIIPANLAAHLYNQGQDIRVAAAVVWGIFYLVGTEEVSSWDDLRDRDIGIFGRGLSPDLIFRHIALSRGLDPDSDLQLHYASSASELAPALITGKTRIALIPEPMVSTVLAKAPDARILFDLQEEWAAVSSSASSYPQAVLVVRGEFLREHPDFYRDFMKDFAGSVDWLNAHPDEAGVYAAKLMEGSNPAILAAAVPRMKLKFEDAEQAAPAIEEYLSVLLEADPESLGGGLPDADFYAGS